LWAHSIELLLKSIWKTIIKGGSSGKDDVLIKIFSNIKITFLDSCEGHGVHSRGFISLFDETWVEKSFWSHESWSVDIDCLTIRELVWFLDFT